MDWPPYTDGETQQPQRKAHPLADQTIILKTQSYNYKIKATNVL